MSGTRARHAGGLAWPGLACLHRPVPVDGTNWKASRHDGGGEGAEAGPQAGGHLSAPTYSTY